MAVNPIPHVAELIAVQIEGSLMYNDPMWTLADARAVNETTGWTFETSVTDPGRDPLNNWVRHQEIVLDEATLIAAYIRGWRVAMEWSQQRLAERLGVTVNTLARWERGDLTVRHQPMLALALERLALEGGK